MIEQKKFRVKILSFLMVAIPIAAISYFYVYENMENRRQAEIDKNIMIAKSTALFIESQITERINSLERMALLPVFREGSPEEIQGYLDIFEQSNNEGFFVADISGKVIAQTVVENLEEYPNMRECKYFSLAVKAGKPIITNQHKSQYTNKYVINIFAPVLDDSGKVVRVLGNHLDNTLFKGHLDLIKIGETGHLSLVDSQGYYIYDKKISNGDELVVSKCYYDGLGQDVSITERASNTTGEKTIYTKVKIKKLGWYLVAFQKSEELTARVIEVMTKNLVTLVLIFVVLLVLNQYQKSLIEKEELIEKQKAEKLALIGELAVGMANEIRNPLTTIKGFNDLLRSKEKYSGDSKAFSLINGSIKQIESLVNEIMLMAKPQKLEIRQVNLQNNLTEICEDFRQEALSKEVKLELELCDYPLLIKGDERQLRHALVNLIRNSLDATGKGDVISVMLDCPDRLTARIVIQDTGEGISPEDFGKVGTPFFSTKENGIGLGFMIAQRIIEEHEGKLEIKSVMNQGTTVEITLPTV